VIAALLAAATLSGAPCAQSNGLAAVRAFASAWDRGDVASATALWAREPAFQWLSGPGRYGSAAYERSTLIRYVRSRARLHERLRIVTLRGGYDPRRNIFNFSGMLSRGGLVKPFKGALTCVEPRALLIVWSM
jgi:hypothetical protein